jgi:hypothetical protein
MIDTKTAWPGLEDDEAFLRAVTFPEEERRLFTTAPWSGGYRWFRSPNVVPIEKARQKRNAARACARPPL